MNAGDEKPCSLRGTGPCSCPTACQINMDAARWQWIRDVPCNQFYLERNADHACNYMTAKDWIESEPQDFSETPADQLQDMKDTNTIWTLQIYPDTPIGSYRIHGATPEAVVDAMMIQRSEKGGAA